MKMLSVPCAVMAPEVAPESGGSSTGLGSMSTSDRSLGPEPCPREPTSGNGQAIDVE